MHVTDYWKKIINEIILIKESDIKIDDSAILVGGGGSEPCLVLPDGDGGNGDEVYDIRKAVSANNVQEQLDNSFQLELDQRRLSKSNEVIAVKKDSVIRVSENFLTVPGGHRRTRASTPSSGSDEGSNYEELNEDTITSLRQFVAVAKIGQSAEEWAENNLPSWSSRIKADSVDNVTSGRRSSLGLGRTVSLNTEATGGRGVERRPSTRSTLSRNSTR